MKKIYDIHHYLGTFFFLLFLIWFLSGFVMMYKQFPFLSEQDRVNSHLEGKLSLDEGQLPERVFRNDSILNIHKFLINRQLNRTIYHVETSDGRIISRYADNGEKVFIDEQKAKRIALGTVKGSFKSSVAVMNEVDQWIPRPRYLKHLPVYKVSFDDHQQTKVYVSSLTGEVISLTNQLDRFWAWVGAIPHWVYFKDIRLHPTLWSQLVMCLAGFGFVMALSGMITGFARYKKKPKANFKRFKNKWYNIHYYFGLGFGVFVCTWIFSGFMSMTPFDWVPSTVLDEEDQLEWQKESFTLNSFSNDRWAEFVHQIRDREILEVDFFLFNKGMFARVQSSTKGATLLSLDQNVSIPTAKEFQQSIALFDSSDPIRENIYLEEYDSYYYSRRQDKPLPVIRITRESGLSYYINGSTVEILYVCNSQNRLERWLYHGLHSLDFSFLYSNGILWDVVVIILLLGGTVISITATGLGIKFIRRKIRKYLKQV